MEALTVMSTFESKCMNCKWMVLFRTQQHEEGEIEPLGYEHPTSYEVKPQCFAYPGGIPHKFFKRRSLVQAQHNAVEPEQVGGYVFVQASEGERDALILASRKTTDFFLRHPTNHHKSPQDF